MESDYNEIVAEYYDFEADSFERRAGENHVLMTLRNDFREFTLSRRPKKMLEVGYGPGLDMTWFADRDDIEIVHGVDISPEFQRIVENKARQRGDGKILPNLGSAEDIVEIVGESTVDTVYVYFGALNTAKDLESVASAISKVLKPGGSAILTFVNRWYLFEIFWNILLLRPRRAFSRLRPVWNGYSPTRSLPSYCPTAREIGRKFGQFLNPVYRKGYCILHPAWYRKHWAPFNSVRSRSLYLIDRILQRTPLWNFGEYSLYIFESTDKE